MGGGDDEICSDTTYGGESCTCDSVDDDVG